MDKKFVEKVGELANKRAGENVNDLVQWAVARGMSEGDFANLLMKGLAAIGTDQLRVGGVNSEFGATLQGPEFSLQIIIRRITDGPETIEEMQSAFEVKH